MGSVGLCILGFGAGNTLIMRSRAGRRSAGIDVLDLTTVVVVVTALAALVWATRWSGR